MAVICTQKYDLDLNGAIEQPAADLPYLVWGSEDEATIITALVSTFPAVYGGLPYQRYRLKHLGGGVWDATVSYGKAEQRGLDPSTGGGGGPGGVTGGYNFEVGMTAVTLKQSLKTVSKYGRYGDPAPDFEGCINVTGDEVQGIEIDVPTYTWSEPLYLPNSAITDGYKGNLLTVAAAPVNDGVFRGLAAGEVRFLGVTGSKKGSDEWELTFRFAAQPNRTITTIPNMGPVNKDGWDYLWIRYADAVDHNVLTRVPLAVYVEKIYERSDFTLLGLPS